MTNHSLATPIYFNGRIQNLLRYEIVKGEEGALSHSKSGPAFRERSRSGNSKGKEITKTGLLPPLRRPPFWCCGEGTTYLRTYRPKSPLFGILLIFLGGGGKKEIDWEEEEEEEEEAPQAISPSPLSSIWHVHLCPPLRSEVVKRHGIFFTYIFFQGIIFLFKATEVTFSHPACS